MPVKFNISEKGKAWRLELEGNVLSGKTIGEKFDGKELREDLEGYELEITGGSDDSGFPMSKNVEGIGLKRVILTRGWGMRENIEGLRRRKTIRGKILNEKSALINIKVLKEGKKKLSDIFPDQNKKEEPKPEVKEEAKVEAAPAQ